MTKRGKGVLFESMFLKHYFEKLNRERIRKGVKT